MTFYIWKFVCRHLEVCINTIDIDILFLMFHLFQLAIILCNQAKNQNSCQKLSANQFPRADRKM